MLYVGYRGTPAIESCRIDSASGALTSLGRVATEHPPTYLATDRAGKYLLSAYYQGAYAAVHALGTDGAVRGPAVDRQNTAPGAHAILTDPSNRFAFVPHIARQNDNVLEPPKNIPGPNFIAQFRFDPASGRLSPNTPFKLEPREPIGPRTFAFIPRSTSPISRTSRGAASRPTVSIVPRGLCPPWKRLHRCPTASPCAIPVPRSI